MENNLMQAVTAYIPHRGKMLLLDALLSADSEHACAVVHITQNSMFATEHGVPALVGIEYMAQTIAAYSGYIHYSPTQKPKIGMLLGARNYSASLDYFAFASTLHICVKPIYIENGNLALFNCAISAGEQELANAKLNVYEPDNISQFLND